MDNVKLPLTKYSGLDFNNIMKDIFNLIQENPEYNNNWSDFLSGNAGRMLTELFAFITDQLASRIDLIVNENYIGTASQKASLIKLLKLIGFKFSLPAVAAVDVDVSVDPGLYGTIVLKPSHLASYSFVETKSFKAFDKNGTERTYELINFDKNSNKFDYKGSISASFYRDLHLNKDIYLNTLTFYEGKTVKERLPDIDTNDGAKFILKNSPVSANSVSVFLRDITTNPPTEIPMLEVKTFLNIVSQRKRNGSGEENPLTYVLNVANQIGDNINDYKIIVNKSTVPVGTGTDVQNIIASKIFKRNIVFIATS